MTNRNPQASYFRHGEIPVTNPKALEKLQEYLEQGTAIIIEEELAHCVNRIQGIQEGTIIPTTTKKPFERRRTTFDVERLQIIQEDLQLLLSLKKYWENLFRPVGVRMLDHEQNQGAPFEQEIYRELVAEGAQVVRHLVVMIASRAREIDMVAFKIDQGTSKIIVVSSDSSFFVRRSFKKTLKVSDFLNPSKKSSKELAVKSSGIMV